MISRRIVLLLLLSLTIVAGLLSRRWDGVPDWIREHAGDALWTMAVYWSLAIIWPRLNAKVLLLASLGISVAVEFSQLLQWRWLVDLRQTTVGALLLGRGFLVADLFRYSAGSAIAFLLDVTGKWLFQGRARTDKRMAESEGDSGDRLA